MSRIKSFLLILMTIYACASFGGAKIVRTGGDVLMCENYVETYDPNSGTTTVRREGFKYQALDILTNQEFRSLKPKVNDLTGDEVERAQQLVERLRWLDAERVDLYRRWLRDWRSEASEEDRIFGDIPDSANFVEPVGCERLQTIIQERTERGIRYRISRPVWRKLDADTRAFLIVHEVIYREAYAYGHQNSFYVAYLNMLIASDAVYTMTRRQYTRLKIEMGF